MIIDEWQHLQQGDSSVAEYIAKFDNPMIRCNVDEEPVVTLARFRAGHRPEYQRELILREVSTLEKAYPYAANMELYAAHTQRTSTAWLTVPETARPEQPSLASKSAHYLPHPVPRVSSPTTYSLPLPSPPQRLLLPAVPPATPNPAVVEYGNRIRSSAGPQTTRSQVSHSSATERSPEGRSMTGPRP